MSEAPKTLTTVEEIAHEFMGASLAAFRDAIKDANVPLNDDERSALLKSMPTSLAVDLMDRIYDEHGAKGVMTVISRFGQVHPAFAMALGVGSLAMLLGAAAGIPDVPENPDKEKLN